jgi:23S rRNA (guanosine2251-2'-O)-methyltransferase
MIIEGNVSVKAAVLGGMRSVSRVLVDEKKHDKDTAWILHRCQDRKIPVEHVKREVIDNQASGRTHGGLIAEVSPRILQTKEDTIKSDHPFLALVEGVEDPFNLGYIMRTLYSAGCNGLILKKRNWETAEPTILKSSAGAFDSLNVVMSEDPAQDLKWYKSRGVRCYAAMRKDAIAYDEADYTGSCLIAIGGEMRGLSSGVRQEIDQNIYIPYANDFHMALNAAAATAVLAFEVVRQRKD